MSNTGPDALGDPPPPPAGRPVTVILASVLVAVGVIAAMVLLGESRVLFPMVEMGSIASTTVIASAALAAFVALSLVVMRRESGAILAAMSCGFGLHVAAPFAWLALIVLVGDPGGAMTVFGLAPVVAFVGCLTGLVLLSRRSSRSWFRAGAAARGRGAVTVDGSSPSRPRTVVVAQSILVFVGVAGIAPLLFAPADDGGLLLVAVAILGLLAVVAVTSVVLIGRGRDSGRVPAAAACGIAASVCASYAGAVLAEPGAVSIAAVVATALVAVAALTVPFLLWAPRASSWFDSRDAADRSIADG